MVCFIPSATYHSSIFILTGQIMEFTYFVDVIATLTTCELTKFSRTIQLTFTIDKNRKNTHKDAHKIL